MKLSKLTIPGIDNSPAGEMNLIIHDLQKNLQITLFSDDHDGRALAREVLHEAFDVLDGSGRAAGLPVDAISNLQPRLEGALALVQALRRVLSADAAGSR